MTLTKKQILGIIFVTLLIFVLPLTVYLSKKRQDIRPRAMQGKANLLLSASVNSSNVGKMIDVLVSLQLTDPSLKVSGADFLLLYDKEKLDVKNIIPAIPGTSIPNPAFTDALMLSSGGIFDENFNYLRVVEVAKKTDAGLSSGTLTLAKVTFLAKGEGAATIKFPDDNKYIEISGTGTLPIGIATPTFILVTGNPPTSPMPTTSTNTMNLRLEPSTAVISTNGQTVFSLIGTLPGGSSTQKLDYFKVELNFPKDYLTVPAGAYVDTSSSGFKKIFRVDGPQIANETGKIVIELGADVPGGGPATDKPITIAKITFTGKAETPPVVVGGAAGIVIGIANTQVVNNSSKSLSVNSQDASFTVSRQ